MSFKNCNMRQLVLVTDEFLQSEYALNHRRLQTFSHKGCKCVVEGCNKVGTHVLTWYQRLKNGSNGGKHVDIVGYENGQLFLMTVDHIIPRSLGGSDLITNKQPMCEHHNSQKGNKLIYIPKETLCTG